MLACITAHSRVTVYDGVGFLRENMARIGRQFAVG